MQHNRYLVPCLVFAVLALLLLPLSGCESDSPATYPVKGKVTYPDGSPVTRGMVGFELITDNINEAHNARGIIHEDGTYFLTTFDKEGDGAVLGRHRVIVQEPDPEADVEEGERLPPQVIDTRYRTYQGSGLEYEVTEGENVIDITVTRPPFDSPATYPVKGKVTFPDGSPVTKGMVGFELITANINEAHNARGIIHEDGTYFLTTFDKEGDGAVLGRHKVIVQEPYPEAAVEAGERLPPLLIDTRYRTYQGSGLEYEVTEGENVIDITVTHPGGRLP